MESPLDILSRAAGMVMPTTTPPPHHHHHQNNKKRTSAQFCEEEEEEEQPLDFSCKKRRGEELDDKKSGIDHSHRSSVIAAPHITRSSPPTPTPTPTPSPLPLLHPLKKRLSYKKTTPTPHSSSSDPDSSPSSTHSLLPRKLIKRRQISKPRLHGQSAVARKQIQVDKLRRVVVISGGGEGGGGSGGAVEEHFRRSLERYTTPTEGREKGQGKEKEELVREVDQIGSVDDHFAKALGSETWNSVRMDAAATKLNYDDKNV